jgi:hypothetical protein
LQIIYLDSLLGTTGTTGPLTATISNGWTAIRTLGSHTRDRFASQFSAHVQVFNYKYCCPECIVDVDCFCKIGSTITTGVALQYI